MTANEGDTREWEEIRVENARLDPTAFRAAQELKDRAALGRLQVTRATGDTDGDGDLDEIHAFGARSFSIWSATGQLVFDSGDDFERITAAVLPDFFNSDNVRNSFDTRSPNRGPEPEGVALGRIGVRTYAFIGLERIGGIMVYDVTNPVAPRFQQYINTRDISAPDEPPAGDVGPEDLLFIPQHESPSDAPLLIVTYELSNSVALYRVRAR